ncbi:methyl-accepting chemotaxis protein [Rhizobium sp. SL86]|uniref:methyl-accepting chemotaxis protein n=1 Tax=Rhizobium sp. SL86 TaxID=2995148 RepID=UPI002276B852|nr:methyl-accepting chemotaxis protein [Rhizobium sp. SL86]MCY1667580.1 methyl-accepting chemotaxis protein [Rhizobium sp. SL86]
MSVLKAVKIRSKILMLLLILSAGAISGLSYIVLKFSATSGSYNSFLTNESQAAIWGPRGAAGIWTAVSMAGRLTHMEPSSPDYTPMLSKYEKDFKAAIERYETVATLVPSRAEAVNEILGTINTVKTNYDKMIALHAQGNTAESDAIKRETDTALQQMSSLMGANNNAMVDMLKEGASRLEAETNFAIAFSISALLVGLIACLGLSIYIAQVGITTPMARLRERMEGLALGDTAAEIPGLDRRDEVGQMAMTLQVFRDSAIARMRLEEDADANRRLTDNDRLVREQQKAKEAEDVACAVECLATGLSKLSVGDVSYRIDQPFVAALDSLRANFNQSAEKLEAALSQVAQNAKGIDSGANEIRSAADDLAKRTEQQAAAVEETAAALEEITTATRDSAKRAQEAGELVTRTRRGAEQSGEIVRRAVVAMGRIEKSSSEIGNIVGVIDEIAFQTNLLALNAGVEAARAGDAGKGFAVVAQEVRELAQRSANAAKEIKQLISSSNEHVNEGVKLVGETGNALEMIVSDVQEVNRHVVAIVESAQEQSSGLQQINAAVNQMDQETQRNAAMVEESNAASHNLAKEAMSLNDLLAQFKIRNHVQRMPTTVDGNAAASPSVASPARALARRLATAFNGNAATANEWREF